MLNELSIGLASVAASIIGWVWLYSKNRAIKHFVELPAKINKLEKKEVSSEGFNKEFNIDIEYQYQYLW